MPPATATSRTSQGPGAAPTLADRFRALPRAIRWALLGGGTIILLLLYNDYVLSTVVRWKDQADRLQQALHRTKAVNDGGRVVGTLAAAVETIGPVEVPGDESASSVALKEAVNETLDRHNVGTNDSLQPGTPGKLPRGTMSDIVGGGEARYLTANLEFESTVDVAVKIISELESSPAIESISSLRVTKTSGAGGSSGKKVSVRLTLEAWMIAPAAAGKAGGR
jgi:hypothetical protein